MITDEVSDDVAVQLAALWRLEKSARRKRIRFVPQHHEMDCAAACLETVVQTYGRRAGLARCRAVVRDGRDGASLRDLQIGAEALGLECLGLRIDFSTDLQDIPLPVVVGVEHHFVVVYGTSKGVALVMDPALGKTQMSLTELTEKSSGICLAMAPTAAFWEWPEIRPDYRRYTALLARHWKVLTVAFLCSVALLALGTVGPFLSQLLFDEVMPNLDGDLLVWVALGYVTVSVFSNVAQWGRQWLFSEVAYRIDRRLSIELYDRFFGLSVTEFTRHTPGDVSAALDEVSGVRSFLTGQVMETILEVGNLIVYLALLWSLTPQLMVLALIIAPIYAGIPWLVGPVVRRARAVVLQRSAKLDTVLLEQIAGIRTIKALGAETDAKSAYVDRLNDFLVNIRNSHRRTLPFRSATQLFESLVSIVTLLFGARWVLTGELTVGEMVAGTLLVSEFLSPVAALAEKGVDLQESRISLDRLEDGFAQEPEDAGGAHLGPVSGDIVFEDVSFRFAPTTPLVLQKLNLTLKQGEITAVVGRSGSGKTTIAQLILRLLVPEAGRVTIGGRDVAEFEREHLRRNTGLALSEHPLFQGTILKNIALGTEGPPDTVRAFEACAAAQIIEFVNGLPGDINSRVPESGLGLSSGQKQRLALARLFYRRSDVMLLDEVTSYLDAGAEARVLKALRALSPGRTILFITHRPSIVKTADRIVLLEEGRITRDIRLNEPGMRAAREAEALSIFEGL